MLGLTEEVWRRGVVPSASPQEGVLLPVQPLPTKSPTRLMDGDRPASFPLAISTAVIGMSCTRSEANFSEGGR